MTGFQGSFIRVVATVLAGTVLAVGISLLTGCPSQTQEQQSTSPVVHTSSFHGLVYGGRQAIVAATVVAYAVATTPGATPTQIGITATDSSGNFTMTFSPAPTAGQLIYVVATDGDAGAGVNSAIGLMTVAGIEGSTLAPVVGTVNINEFSTVAATATLQDAIAFVGCATITGNTRPVGDACLAIPGAPQLLSLALRVNKLVDVSNGERGAFLASRSATAGAPLRSTLERLNTLASVLASCVNTSGPASSACANLFDETSGQPNTLMAAWMIANMPAVQFKAQALFGLLPTLPVFTPVLAGVPATTAEPFWKLGGARYVFAANLSSKNVSVWTVNAASDDLSEVAGSVCGGSAAGGGSANNCVAAGDGPISVAVDSTGRTLYAANRLSDNVSVWTINATTGALTEVAGSACGGTVAANNCVAAGNAPYAITASLIWP